MDGRMDVMLQLNFSKAQDQSLTNTAVGYSSMSVARLFPILVKSSFFSRAKFIGIIIRG